MHGKTDQIYVVHLSIIYAPYSKEIPIPGVNK